MDSVAVCATAPTAPTNKSAAARNTRPRSKVQPAFRRSLHAHATNSLSHEARRGWCMAIIPRDYNHVPAIPHRGFYKHGGRSRAQAMAAPQPPHVFHNQTARLLRKPKFLVKAIDHA